MNPQDSNMRSTSIPPAPAQAPLFQTGSETMRTSIFLPPMLPGGDQGPPQPSALNAAPTAFTLWRAFQRRWPLALGVGLAAALLGGLLIIFLFPAKFVTYYCAKVNSTKGVELVTDKGENPDFTIFKAFQANLASKSRNVINRALNLQVNGKFMKDLSIVRSQRDPVDWLQSSIKTDFLRAHEIMQVTLGANDPEELTLLLNALAKSLVEENRINEENKHASQIEQTQAKERQLQTDMGLKRKIFRERLKGLGPDPASLGKKLDSLELDLREARTAQRNKSVEASAARNKLRSINERIQNPDQFSIPDAVLNEFLRGDPEATLYLKQIDQANLDYATAQRVVTDPGSPILQKYTEKKTQAERELANFRSKRMPDILRKYREKLASEGNVDLIRARDDVKNLEEQEQLLKDNLDRVEAEVARFRPGAGLPTDVVQLQQEIESLEKALARINENIAYMRVNLPTSRVSILQEAIEPHAKDTSRQMKMAGAGSIGLFLMAVLGISFFEFRSRKITSSDEVGRGLGLPVIGTVPTLPEKARSPIAQSKLDPYWQNQLMESVDTIRTMLLHNARGNNTRVIMVTSAVGGEGKTSLSSQLAASLARAWKKTLLIDGDLRNPAAHKLFDVPQEPGLSEVLRGELNASEAVRSTPLSRLWVLPAGHWDSHAVQALAQDNVRTMLEELKQQYDFIILDSCPILPVADSLLLGQNVDGVLLTVMRDLSRSPAVHAAQQRLENLGIKILGAVVIGAKNELGPLGYKYAYQARPQ